MKPSLERPKLKMFIEGGGEKGEQVGYLDIRMREAFNCFFVKAGVPERQFQIVRCGSRDQAYRQFTMAIKNRQPGGAVPLLLVDSEEPVTDRSVWGHLRSRDGWVRPLNPDWIVKKLRHKGIKDEYVREEQVHLMTQCMETWFLANPKRLADYYGHGFQSNLLPKTRPIEEVAKKDLLEKLDLAAKQTAKKGYSKGDHSFNLLERLDPFEVARISPSACRLLKTLDDYCLGKLGRSTLRCVTRKKRYQRRSNTGG